MIAKRRPDGGVAEWVDLAQLEIRPGRRETTMFGFECRSGKNVRGDAIALVRHHRDGSFTIKRAWKIDTKTRQFVVVPPQTVICESLD